MHRAEPNNHPACARQRTRRRHRKGAQAALRDALLLPQCHSVCKQEAGLGEELAMLTSWWAAVGWGVTALA